MGSRGGGFLSLVVANGAIYNRIFIPRKTQLLTPHRGARQDRGNLAQPPLSLPAGEGANGKEVEGRSLSELPSPLAQSACLRVWLIPVLLQAAAPSLPCLALLSFSGQHFLAEDAWADQDGVEAGQWGWQGTGWSCWWLCPESYLVGLPGRAMQALQSQPCPVLASPSSHSPAVNVFPKWFWH